MLDRKIRITEDDLSYVFNELHILTIMKYYDLVKVDLQSFLMSIIVSWKENKKMQSLLRTIRGLSIRDYMMLRILIQQV